MDQLTPKAFLIGVWRVDPLRGTLTPGGKVVRVDTRAMRLPQAVASLRRLLLCGLVTELRSSNTGQIKSTGGDSAGGGCFAVGLSEAINPAGLLLPSRRWLDTHNWPVRIDWMRVRGTDAA